MSYVRVSERDPAFYPTVTYYDWQGRPKSFDPRLSNVWWIDEDEGETVYDASICVGPRSHVSTSVTEEQYRFIAQFEEARERQQKAEKECAAARWAPPPPPPPPREPDPERVPPQGRLTPRQEQFCQQYAATPIATRAAVLAGFSDDNAGPYGSRLLRNPAVLDRIAQLRAERKLSYVLERDTMHDKLEGLYFDAVADRSYAAAVSALKLQGALAGIFARGASAKESTATRKANKSQHRRAKKPTKAKIRGRRKPAKANQSQ